MKMKIYNSYLAALFAAVMLAVFMLVPITVRAEGADAAGQYYSYELPVTVKVSGDKAPANAAYTIKIEAVTDGAPLPANSTLTFNGEGTQKFDAVTYSVPDDYTYKVSQIAGTDTQTTYDTTEYEVIFHVINSEDGSGMTAVIVNRVGTDSKPSEISFTNQYQKPAEPSTDKPSEPSTDKPEEPSTDKPAEPTTEKPTEPTTEAPTEPDTEEPTEPDTEAPTEPDTEEPTEPDTEKPTEPTTEKPKTPDKGSTPNASTGVKTGDNSPLMTWTLISIMSLIVICGVIFGFIRRRKHSR